MFYWVEKRDGSIVAKGQVSAQVKLNENQQEVSKEEYESILFEQTQEGSIIPTQEKIDSQVVEKIRERYDINEEFKMINIGIANQEDSEYVAYRQYVEECRDWGEEEKKKFGLL